MKTTFKNTIIAHRGVHNSKIIENTLPSFIKCVDKNYIIELDIHILKDRNIVIYHDFNLFRLCKVNKIIETMTYAQLSKIKIKNKYIIPTLKKVMNIINKKVPLLIEIKDLNNNSSFEEELVKILDNYHGDFAIQSSNPLSIKWFIKNRPNYKVGLIILNKSHYKILKKYINKVDFLSVNKNLLPLKVKNKNIIGWTITNKKEYCKYISQCDNLICEKFI